MNPLIQLKKAIPPSGFSSPRAFMALLLCTAAAGSDAANGDAAGLSLSRHRRKMRSER